MFNNNKTIIAMFTVIIILSFVSFYSLLTKKPATEQTWTVVCYGLDRKISFQEENAKDVSSYGSLLTLTSEKNERISILNTPCIYVRNE